MFTDTHTATNAAAAADNFSGEDDAAAIVTDVMADVVSRVTQPRPVPSLVELCVDQLANGPQVDPEVMVARR